MLFHRELAANLNVCTSCDHHMAISPRDRFTGLFDVGVFVGVKVPDPVVDPLHFRDQKKYPDRLKTAQKATGEREAMLVAEGEVGRTPIVAVAQDFSFMAGSMGMYVGNAIIAAAQRAVATKRPLVLFAAAGGARMQEGILSLMQMPRTTVAVQMLKEAGLPYVVVLTHPTTGVTASYAMLGDVQIAEAERADLFRRPAGDRADHSRKATRGLPTRRISAGSWHVGPGDASESLARGIGDDPADADEPIACGEGRSAAAGRYSWRRLRSKREF